MIGIIQTDGDEPNDKTFVLFVKLKSSMVLSNVHSAKIYKNIRTKLSPKHLPRKIFQVQDIPYTINGKKTELAVKKILRNQIIENIDSVRNPDCLDEYKIN